MKFRKSWPGGLHQIADQLLQIDTRHIFDLAIGLGALLDHSRVGEDLGQYVAQISDAVRRRPRRRDKRTLRFADLLTQFNGPDFIGRQRHGFAQSRHIR